jgi:hypothetical protein
VHIELQRLEPYKEEERRRKKKKEEERRRKKRNNGLEVVRGEIKNNILLPGTMSEHGSQLSDGKIHCNNNRQ